MSAPGDDRGRERERRAYRLGIVNGILFMMGMAFIDPLTVLPALVSRLTSSEVLIGGVSTLGMSGWFLPQIFAANYLQSRPFKRPLYVCAAAFRTVGLISVVLVLIGLAEARPAAALAAFFLAYTCYSLAGGFSGPAFLDIVAKTIPGARLGAFFGHRHFWGSMGAIACGALVRTILASDALAFPTDYALLFAGSLLLFAPGWVLFSMIQEPRGRVVQDPRPLLPFLMAAPRTVRRHREFRLLLMSRMLSGAIGIALPFYVVYARRVLSVPESTIGTYIAIQMTGSVVLVPLWAYLNDRRGPRSLLVAAMAVYLGAAGIAFTASLFSHAPPFGRAAFMVVFFPLAAIGSGSFMGYTNYLFAIAPEEQRTLYIGIQNTLFAVTAFLPLLGGALVAATSFSLLFGLATALAAAALAVTLHLPGPACVGPPQRDV
jgi:MFS family permease